MPQLKSENDLLLQAIKKNTESLDHYKEKTAIYEMNDENLKETVATLHKEKDVKLSRSDAFNQF